MTKTAELIKRWRFLHREVQEVGREMCACGHELDRHGLPGGSCLAFVINPIRASMATPCHCRAFLIGEAKEKATP